MASKSVIITAGGIGKRMNSNVPKQFLTLNDLPIICKTISTFFLYDKEMEILVTLPEDYIPDWRLLIEKYQFNIPHKVVTGGLERYHSVKNALAQCSGEWIAVHDAVRPLIDVSLIEECFAALRYFPAVVPVIELKDSLRKLDGNTSHSVSRKEFKLVQTPQCFLKDILINAYTHPFDPSMTDDASIVEKNGIKIHLVEGRHENIKITTHQDLLLAKELDLIKANENS